MSRHSQGTCKPTVGKELFQMLQREAAHLERKELELSAQIRSLSETLASVRSSLSIKRARASECMKRFSPAARLPNETLVAIFWEVVRSQDVSSQIRAESVMSCVSQRWRRIILHTPRLWTRVCVTPDMDERDMRLHILRSAALPLDVEICGWWDYLDSFMRPLHFDRTLAAILPSASRWRCVTISMLCDSLLTCLSFILRTIGFFDTLQRVTFEAQYAGQMCPPTLLMGNLAPNLRSVDVENIALTVRSHCLRRHDFGCFIGVTHLTLRLHDGESDTRALKTTTEFQAFRALLSHMPNLVSLSLYGEPICFKSAASIEDESNAAAMTLPRLRTLILHPNTVQPRYMRNLIAMIRLPDLRHLELVYPDNSIRGLDISDLLFKEGHGGESTPRFPLVEHLVINNAAGAGAFIQAFPGIERLTISGADVEILNQQSMETRESWRNITRLTVRLPQKDGLTLVIDWLDAMTSYGEVQAPLLRVEGPIDDCPTFLHLYEELKRRTRVELLNMDLN